MLVLIKKEAAKIKMVINNIEMIKIKCKLAPLQKDAVQMTIISSEYIY